MYRHDSETTEIVVRQRRSLKLFRTQPAGVSRSARSFQFSYSYYCLTPIDSCQVRLLVISDVTLTWLICSLHPSVHPFSYIFRRSGRWISFWTYTFSISTAVLLISLFTFNHFSAYEIVLRHRGYQIAISTDQISIVADSFGAFATPDFIINQVRKPLCKHTISFLTNVGSFMTYQSD